jgi:hypothetical protein
MKAPPEVAARVATVTLPERRWVLLASLAVVAVTCVPYLFGWYITPPGYQYMGLLANPDEHNVYLGWMRQAERGRLLFFDPFTTEPQQAAFFHIFFLVLGLLGRVTHIPLIAVYHGARVASGLLLLIGVYGLAAQLSESVLARRLAWGFAAFSSGFGWLYALARPAASVNPIDFGPGLVMPEAITFLSLLLNPLFCFSVWLMVVLWTGYLVAVRTGSWKPALLAGVAGLVLGNVHTYNVITVWLTLAAYVGVVAILDRRLPKRELTFATIIGAMAAPFVIYQYWLYEANSVFREKALTPTLTPPPALFLIGYGIVLALAIGGAAVVVARRNRSAIVMVAWAVVTLALVFAAPFSFQRKLAEGLHIPLCVLAALFIGEWAAPRMRARGATTLAVALVIASAPSNVFFVARGFRDLTNNNAAYVSVLMPPLYLTQDSVDAMIWLRRNTAMTDAVLCMPLEGSYVPGVAGNEVFIGHWAETLRYRDKLKVVRWFFSARPQAGQRREFMQTNGLRYVLYTPNEAALGPFNPAASNDFQQVFARPQAMLFRLAGSS